MVRHISPMLVDDMDDWQVLLALTQRGLAGLITLDYSMLDLPKEMAVVHQTKTTLIAIEAAGDNVLRAVGQLMTHLPTIVKAWESERPQVFRLTRPRGAPPISAWDRLGEIASDRSQSIEEIFNEVRLSPAELANPVI